MKKSAFPNIEISRLFPSRQKRAYEVKSEEVSVLRIFSCLPDEYISPELFLRILGSDLPIKPILDDLKERGIIRKNEVNESYQLCAEGSMEDLTSTREFKALISMISEEADKAKKAGDFSAQRDWMELCSSVLEKTKLPNTDKNTLDRTTSIINTSILFCSVIITGKDTVIGIKYDEENMFAPMITFVEKGISCDSIISAAKNLGVPVTNNNMLAKNLSSLGKIGYSIPEACYRDVSLVIARSGAQKQGRHIKKYKTSRIVKNVEIPAPISVELGVSLYSLYLDGQGKINYLEKPLANLKVKLEKLLGLNLQAFTIKDNTSLAHDAYSILFKGLGAGQGKMDQSWFPGVSVNAVAKIAFTKIVDHVDLILQRYAPELLGRDEVDAILEAAEEKYPILCGEVKSLLPLGPIREVLQSLVSENISIKPIDVILETLADWSAFGPAPGEFIVEQIRLALKRQICLDYTDEDLTLRVLTLEPELEKKFVDFTNGVTGESTKLEAQEVFEDLVSLAQSKMEKMGYPPVILCSPRARFMLKEITKRKSPYLAVLSYVEIPSDIRVEQIGEIKLKGNVNG